MGDPLLRQLFAFQRTLHGAESRRPCKVIPDQCEDRTRNGSRPRRWLQRADGIDRIQRFLRQVHLRFQAHAQHLVFAAQSFQSYFVALACFRYLRVDVASEYPAESHEDHAPQTYGNDTAEFERRVIYDEGRSEQAEENMKLQEVLDLPDEAKAFHALPCGIHRDASQHHQRSDDPESVPPETGSAPLFPVTRFFTDALLFATQLLLGLAHAAETFAHQFDLNVDIRYPRFVVRERVPPLRRGCPVIPESLVPDHEGRADAKRE